MQKNLSSIPLRTSNVPYGAAPKFHGDQLVDMKYLVWRLSISQSTINRYIAEGRFPPKIYVTDRRVRWRLSDVEEWLQKREQLQRNQVVAFPMDGPHNIFKPC
jgi:predicted DNA-binding transcriptional regulator AlpA